MVQPSEPTISKPSAAGPPRRVCQKQRPPRKQLGVTEGRGGGKSSPSQPFWLSLSQNGIKPPELCSMLQAGLIPLKTLLKTRRGRTVNK